MKKIVKILVPLSTWIALSVIMGAVTGVVGAVFHKLIEYVTGVRMANDWLIFLLPIAGVAINLLYKVSKEPLNTDTVIESIRGEKKPSFLMAPLIFVGTAITHLTGGSAGREGAALQIGGGIGGGMGKVLKLDEPKVKILTVCGMSGAFSAIFTTPVTAVLFSLEVASVGHIRYFEMLPCILSSATAFIISISMGNHVIGYKNISAPSVSAEIVAVVLICAILFSLAVVLFSNTMEHAERFMKKVAKNAYIRAFLAGVIILLITLALGTRMYNGAGMETIDVILSGDDAKTFALLGSYHLIFAFLIKMVMTAITSAGGFKGGEIVPGFFVGTTLGVLLSTFLPLDASFAASLGMVTVFAGITNCPMGALVLSAELFGTEGLLYYALSIAICFIVSGKSGLYKSQRLVYSKYGIEKTEGEENA